MTKQEKIKEAYGEYWETAKDYVDDFGWCMYQLNDKQERICGFAINSFIKCEFNNFKQDNANYIYYVRPISLRGIENNNGWIKIGSEDENLKDWLDRKSVV